MAKKKTFNFGRLKLFVLIGVLIYVGVTFVNQQSLLVSQRTRQATLTEQEESLQREIEYYQNELDYIGSDEYVEQEARSRFGWLKPGETKYVEGAQSAPAATQPPADNAAAASADNAAAASAEPTASAQPESTPPASEETPLSTPTPAAE